MKATTKKFNHSKRDSEMERCKGKAIKSGKNEDVS